MSTDSNNSPAKKTRRIPRKVKIFILVMVLGLIVIWNFLPARTINQPVALERDESGQMKPVTKDIDQWGVEFKAHAGSLKAKNSMNTSMVAASSSPKYFASHSVAIINLSDHLLMKRVGEEVLEKLKKDDDIQRLEYFPFGYFPESGSLATDLILTLDLVSLDSGLLDQSLNAEMIATWGTSFASSNHSVFNQLSPPISQIHSKIKLTHESTLMGVESSPAKYMLQGKNIGAEIVKTFSNQLNEYRKKLDDIPDLSEGFYPEYQPTPEFDFLKANNAQQLISLRGFCFQNETFWRINNATMVNELLKSIHTELLKKGWKGHVGSIDSQYAVHQRMEKAGQILEVFSKSRRNSILQEIDEKTPVNLFVRYRNPMKIGTYHTIFENMLTAQKLNYNLLVDMQSYLSPKQREQLIEIIKKKTPSTTNAWMFLANHYQKKKEKTALVNALSMANHLTYSMTDYSSIQSKIHNIMKKEKLDIKTIEQIDPKLFKKLGFPILEIWSKPLTQEINEGETAIFFAQNDNDKWKILSVIFHKIIKKKTETLFETTVIQSSSNKSRSWSRGTHNSKHSQINRANLGSLRVDLDIKLTEEDVLRVTAKVGK